MKIKDKRMSLSMTQNDIAILLGVSRATVAMWETKKAVPNVEKLLSLAKIFDCSIEELLE